ncbi:MAG: hypothetical protein RLZZ230_408 [Candidatus Parcubacteria bacterium]|jgi:hypothetical protein
MKKIFLCIVIAFCVNNIVQAGTTSWSYSNYDQGTYVPLKGSFAEGLMSGGPSGTIYTTNVRFTFNTKNVASIIEYNKGIGAHPDCNGELSYLTVDMSAVPDAYDLELDAYLVKSNLPNPKFDIETDPPSDFDHEESETVVLGTVSSGKSYYMTTYWADERDGGTGDGGLLQVQFGMSQKGFSDYNTCINSKDPQIVNRYGRSLGTY